MKKLFTALLLLVFIAATGQKYYLFIGTYTNTGSRGIYVYRFDAATGKATFVSNTDSLVNPSFLTIAPDGRHVYAVTETAAPNGGSVSSFSFDKINGRLTFINKQQSGGDDPCYISIANDEKWLVAANYSGGSLAVFKVNANGSLQPYSQLIQHKGSSINKKRQEKAHVHCTIFTPDQKYLLTPDLGMDEVSIYRFNPHAAKPLTPAAQPFAQSRPGHGPRHIVFSPNHQFAYLMEEMGGDVVVYRYANGKLMRRQEIAAHPAGFKGNIGSADIHFSPDGKFLYTSNRGDENTITIFSVNAATGKLTLNGYQLTLGKTPRNFIIDPTGNYLLVANQNTNNIVVMKINKLTGLLTPTGEEIQLPIPVCLKMTEE